MEKLTIKVKYFADMAPLEKIKIGDCIDLRSAVDVRLDSGEFRMIPLGVGMKLPEGYEAHVYPRSSTFKRWGIIQANSVGIIDNSYSGDDDQWHFPAFAVRDTQIQKGDRICQFRIMKSQPEIELVTVECLDEVSRGGLGSTGRS